jgi:hypothetical protein
MYVAEAANENARKATVIVTRLSTSIKENAVKSGTNSKVFLSH